MHREGSRFSGPSVHSVTPFARKTGNKCYIRRNIGALSRQNNTKENNSTIKYDIVGLRYFLHSRTSGVDECVHHTLNIQIFEYSDWFFKHLIFSDIFYIYTIYPKFFVKFLSIFFAIIACFSVDQRLPNASALRERVFPRRKEKRQRGETTHESPRVRARMLDPRQTVVGASPPPPSPPPLAKASSLVPLLPLLFHPFASRFLEVRSVCIRVSPSFPFIAVHSSASPSSRGSWGYDVLSRAKVHDDATTSSSKSRRAFPFAF